MKVCGFLLSGLFVHQRADYWDDGVSHRVRASSAALGAGRGLLQVGLCPLNAAAHIYSLRLEDLLWQVTLLTHIPARCEHSVGVFMTQKGVGVKVALLAFCFCVARLCTQHWCVTGVFFMFFSPGATLCGTLWTSSPSWRWFLKSSWSWQKP